MNPGDMNRQLVLGQRSEQSRPKSSTRPRTTPQGAHPKSAVGGDVGETSSLANGASTSPRRSSSFAAGLDPFRYKTKIVHSKALRPKKRRRTVLKSNSPHSSCIPCALAPLREIFSGVLLCGCELEWERFQSRCHLPIAFRAFPGRRIRRDVLFLQSPDGTVQRCTGKQVLLTAHHDGQHRDPTKAVTNKLATLHRT